MALFKFSTCCSCGAVVAFLLALAVPPAAADMIPPRKPPKADSSPAAPLVVRRDASQETCRIIIPRKLLPGGKIAPAIPPAPYKTSVEEDDSVSLEHRSINVGILLTTVITGGGMAVAFARRRKAGTGTYLSIGLVVSLLLIGTAVADIPVPGGGARTRYRRPSPNEGATVVVETVDAGDQVVLILGRNAPALLR